RWATWAAVASWFPWGWREPVYFEYGDTVYYQGDTVYYGDQPVASAEEYAAQAQEIAEAAPEPTQETEWLSLGVFALTQEGDDAPNPTLYLQLAVSKDGLIAGTFFDEASEVAKPLEGAVDKESQRSAWTVVDKKWPVMEAGIANLTKDTVPVLIHFEDGQTQRWLLVRLEEPMEAQAGQSDQSSEN
ncbi:MAG: protocadherin, partial [Planctomycetes bacterium]|nr:protocadherin [Planctomycetota bacterium]